jgi:phthalate 4,5-dioxygenase
LGDAAPNLEIEETPYGHRIFTSRRAGAENYVRITNFIMPNCSAFDGVPLFNPRAEKFRPNLGYQMHWHVPINDGEHWKYTILYRYEGALDLAFVEKGLFGDVGKDYRSPRNAQNRYLQSRDEMKTETFAGVGRNFYDQDLLAVEAQGRIMDRSNEHLGTTDRPIILMRKQLIQAVEDVRAGRTPLFVERDSNADALADMVVRSDLLPASTDVRGGWWRQQQESTSALALQPGQ